MTNSRFSICAAGLLLVASVPTRADELLPANRPIEEAIDHHIDGRLKAENVTPAGQADDATLIRRLTLDLNGRIPTVAEVQAFASSNDPNKRAKLVDRLMASPAFVRHQAGELDVMLAYGTRGSLREYLTEAVRDNKPWDRVFRELLLPDEKDPKQKGASNFLKGRVTDLDRLTNEVSVLFFGVNVSCAQCHDHPHVQDWKQDHFYGMKSFFARTFDNGGFVGERSYGTVKFKPIKGAEKTAKMMFLTGKTVEGQGDKEPTNEEMKAEKAKLDELKKNKQPPPPPAFSARAQLVDVSLQAGEREYFARSIANRTWQRFFGLGLVNPVDQMHAENAPTHPELLEWLARDTIEHGYDLRRLVRGVVMSKAYSRSSRWEGERNPNSSLFAVARIRPLGPLQLAGSMRLATADPATLGADVKPEELEKRIEQLESSARGFASSLEQPREDFQVSVVEALLFSNSERVQKEYLTDGSDRLLGRLKTIKEPKEQVTLAVRTVLCREPTADEMRLLTEYLERRQDRPLEGCRQMMWALLTSPEFRFNH